MNAINTLEKLQYGIETTPGTLVAADAVMLAPRGQSSDMESLHKRYDAWKEALKDALDDAVAADGNADVFLTQEFGDLAFFEDVDVGWGFDMTFGELQLSETKTFGP